MGVFRIRTSFREILKILSYQASPDYTDEEKAEIMFRIFYPEWRTMDRKYYREYLQAAVDFIDMGNRNEQPKATTMDWDQDALIIIPSVNKVLGYDVRSKPELHWWTFLAAYMEIGEGLFSTVLSIRQKKSKGKKLETWEQEFYRDNKKICDLATKYSKAEIEEQERLKALI